MKTALGKLWTTVKQQQKLCRAPKLMMATKKGVGSILPVSLHPPVQSSSTPRRIPSEEFRPRSEENWRTPAVLVITMSFCSLCY